MANIQERIDDVGMKERDSVEESTSVHQGNEPISKP